MIHNTQCPKNTAKQPPIILIAAVKFQSCLVHIYDVNMPSKGGTAQ